MKVFEITGGSVATLRVRSVDEPFDPLPFLRDEVSLFWSADQALLAAGGKTWAIHGTSPAEQVEVVNVVGSGLPLVAFVAQATPAALVLETRRFFQDLRIAEPMDFGLDEKALDDVRKVHRYGGTVADTAEWLEDRLLLPPSPQGPATLRRMVVSGDLRSQPDAFRIYGHRLTADVRRVDQKLRIEKIGRGTRGGNQRITLLHAPVRVVDATAAAALHGTTRALLSEAVMETGSYLRYWQEWHRLEKEQVHRRYEAVGILTYHKCERRRDDSWRFHLDAVADLADRLAAMGDGDRCEMEACDQEELPEHPGDSASHSRHFTGKVLGADIRRCTLDLQQPEDSEAPPRPPEAGQLYVSLRGDQTRLRRREEAEAALRTGNCDLPQLGLLMEGRPAPAGRPPRRSALSPGVRELFGTSRPTQRQVEAIELALNTPDICLIQGPPGTGKTKVITAIERRLAELTDEGVERSHRILVTAAQHDTVEHVAGKTRVFGLPAMKVGHRKRAGDGAHDPGEQFIQETLAALAAQSPQLSEPERLSKARLLAISCIRSPALPGDQARRIRDLVDMLEDLLPPALLDRASAHAGSLERPTPGAPDSEDLDLMMRAALGLRVEPAPFADDGPAQARKALRRLDKVLTPDQQLFLERCAALQPGEIPSWLSEGIDHRNALRDRLTPSPRAAEPAIDLATRDLVLEILDTVAARLAATRSGADAAVATYRHELEHDPEGVRDALRHYTVVLASTLQQAEGRDMRRVRGITEGQARFESVIVDEAARAHPLDLFIPLSLAKHRVVLVGDHRQLPHLLEPDVERQLADAVAQGTVEAETLEAVRNSLFERLWVILRRLEEQDGIRRTVTLNAQYRMHPVLGSFVSREFYECHDDGEIESPRPASEFAHGLPDYQKAGTPCTAAWIDVPGDRGPEQQGMSKSRRVEADTIAKEVRKLIDHNPGLTVGVIAFYRDQVNEIHRALEQVGLAERVDGVLKVASGIPLRIGTVDSFQGMEFDVVFLSITRSNRFPGDTDAQRRRKYGHLLLDNRLCVAMSRQQRLLVVVGDLGFVRASPMRSLRAFADLCEGPHGILR